MVKVIHSADFRERMAKIGAEPIGDTPEHMAAQIKNDAERFAKVIKDANITLN